MVRTTGAFTESSAGDRRRGRRDLVLRRRGRVPLRAVTEASVGSSAPGRQLRGVGQGAADRHHRTEGLAQSAFPTSVGTAGGERRPDCGRRSEPEFGSVVRIHPAEGADAAIGAGVSRRPDARSDGHRHRRELPLSASVRRAVRGGGTSALPDPAQSQAGGGVVEHVAVSAGGRAVPVHSGPADHGDGADIPA